MFSSLTATQACLTLSNITAGNAEQIQRVKHHVLSVVSVVSCCAQVIEANAIPRLVDMCRNAVRQTHWHTSKKHSKHSTMREHTVTGQEFDDKRDACWALCNAAGGGRKMQLRFVRMSSVCLSDQGDPKQLPDRAGHDPSNGTSHRQLT
mmetsp:Transcript_23449/g.50909  ORF Transcript_23449/g.50909 Transcript_23449/m.50909 type:complete len:149 (+) Transcript_23449:608-1054(+)